MFDSAILKLTSYCDLNCSYCYMFNLNDETFSKIPKKMSLSVVDNFASKLKSYLGNNGLTEFKIIFHGGEPTLWGEKNFEYLFHRLKTLGCKLDFSLQTNLYSLNLPLLRVLSDHGVKIGISIDGPKDFNDEYRKTLSGHGSYSKVVRNVETILDSGYEATIGGFLVVGNPAVPPEKLLCWMNSMPIRRFDVLWPMHFNWSRPPWVPEGEQAYRGAPEYGIWLSEVFRMWMAQDDPNLYIRLFVNLIKYYLGKDSHGDSMINDLIPYFVVNTDGRYELTDYSRPHADGKSNTGLDVFSTDLHDLERHEGFKFYQNLRDQIPATCKSCRHRGICGGGFLAGRFDNGDDFKPMKKSVLCYDHYYYYSAACKILDKIILASPRKEQMRIF